MWEIFKNLTAQLQGAAIRARGSEEYREHCDVCVHKPMESLEHAT
ncbi:hypothetical protein HMPREF1861_01628 [Corynebacterium kroppenstedtii]|nr:hypothetical protein HMPREF1861_01628 [Corynebacterium kroppenstedtii]